MVAVARATEAIKSFIMIPRIQPTHRWLKIYVSKFSLTPFGKAV